MIDCHIHTKFSPDCNTPPEAVVRQAIKFGLTHIVIADHMDINGATIAGGGGDLPHNAAKYIQTIQDLKSRYKDEIYVSLGVEAGYSSAGAKATADVIKNYPFEYIINSIHIVDGIDCYWESYFKAQAKIGRHRDTVYNRYYETIAESLDCPYPYNAVAHPDYIVRNAPYPNKIFEYSEFAPILDTILKKMIDQDKILEFNTTSYITPLVMPQIFERLYKLGGRKICFSSDAHTTERIGDKYPLACQIMRDIGYKYWTVIQNNKTIELKF
ncbi:MAG: histidinol-phosphatase HisJ family protein [Firmicutes bacterium]|nr:histidinol-phosphatase HisJ family protein [Bacillota bacterium]